MKIKTLYFSMALLATSMFVNAQDSGTCASFIQINMDFNSLQADSIYLINKKAAEINVNAVAESAWDRAFPRVLTKIGRENESITYDLANYPQSEAEGHATFKALWDDNGVYMFITVKDDNIQYKMPGSSWRNDAIEFFFAKARREAGFKQIIIPAMVGATDQPTYPAPLLFESGSEMGSDSAYLVLGFEDVWDEGNLFKWAIKKTTDGFDMEVYMDKDIVTKGNSTTNYGLDKMFAGEIAYDIAGDTGDRECILNMLGNSNKGWSNSNNYGYFKMVDEETGINTPKDAKFNANYNAVNKEIKITSSSSVASVIVYNVAGQVMPSKYNNASVSVSVSSLKQGIYVVNAKDLAGNNLGVQRVVIY